MPTLREVMSTDLVTVTPATTVAAAATVMSTRHVGAALVMEDGALVGIFTERDIVRALASDFAAAAHEIGAWMTKDPLTLGPDATIADALDLMLAQGFRHLPVTDAAQVQGIVSMRDLTARA